MAVFIPQFEVHPHGVNKINGNMFAVFKMIVTYVHPATDTNITQKDFKDFRSAVNKFNWYYEYRNGSLTITTEVSKLVQPTALQFRMKFGDLPPGMHPKFNLGMQYRSIEAPLDSFAFLNRKSFYLRGNQSEVPTKQMMSSGLYAFSENDRIKKRDEMYAILKQAHEYYPLHKQAKLNKAAAVGDKLNLSAIWASVMNEPVCAEERMGLIREFLVPIDEFGISGDSGKIMYSIVCGHTPDGKPYEEQTAKDFEFTWRGKKYYNGKAEKFLNPNRFTKVISSLFDPLKELSADDKAKHPDGIYVIVEYPKQQGSINDAEVFTDEDVKGYRVVTAVDDKHYSLSIHDKELRYVGGAGSRRMVSKYSGLIHPKAELMTEQSNYRSNLLFGWRGDNLSVNREIEPESEEKELQEKGFAEADPDDCKEDAFVTQNLFRTKESLIPRSQLMLNAKKEYTFYLRTASLTEHSIPLNAEIEDAEVLKYTLTLEDYKKDELLPFATIDLSKHWVTPIKAPIIRTDNDVEKRQEHLIRSDRNDNYNVKPVFPPLLKWEDCKALGYIAPDKMDIDVQGSDGLEEYVWKCKELENRVQTEPEYEPSYPINYLADMRAANLELLAADFEAYNAVPKLTIVPAFSFQDKYPYYSNTYPRNIIVERSQGKKRFCVMNGKGDKVIVNSDMKPGIYRFHVMSNEVKRRRTEQCARENLDIVITDTAPAPDTTIITINNKPPVANRFRAQAGTDSKNDNFYYYTFKLSNPGKALGSIKFLQETDVLKLRKPELSNEVLLSRPTLFDHEFPYDFFIQKEGSLKEGGDLLSEVYPQTVSLEMQLPDSFFTVVDTLFTWTIGKYKLTAALDAGKKVILTARSQASNTEGQEADRIIAQGKKLVLTCTLDQASKQHILSVTGDVTASLPLKDFISAQSSLRDIVMEASMVNKISEDHSDDCFLKYTVSETYCIAADLKHPYYAMKKIALFGSSAFQLYFKKQIGI